MHPRAAALIERLQLQAHPEGGFYRQIYRSSSTVQPADDRSVRVALTTIYFLLPEDEHSRWHRVASDEVWHLYEGGPLALYQAPADVSSVQRIVLGQVDVEPGTPASGPVHPVSGPAHTVPANCWQAARSLGPYALAGCTVGPGFEFADFSFLRDVEDLLARLRAIDADLAALA